MSRKKSNQNYRKYKINNPSPPKPVDDLGIFTNKGDRHFLGKHTMGKSGIGKLHPIAVVGEKGEKVSFVTITHDKRGRSYPPLDRKNPKPTYLGREVLTDRDDRVMFVPKYAGYSMRPINEAVNKLVRKFKKKNRK